MATRSSILAWRVPGTEEPGGLQSMELQRLGHDWATFTFTFVRSTEERLSSWIPAGGKQFSGLLAQPQSQELEHQEPEPKVHKWQHPTWSPMTWGCDCAVSVRKRPAQLSDNLTSPLRKAMMEMQLRSPPRSLEAEALCPSVLEEPWSVSCNHWPISTTNSELWRFLR